MEKSERPDLHRWPLALSYSEKRSVAMALEDCSHGGHRAVLSNTFTKGKKKTLREFQQAYLADRNRRTRTFDTLDYIQLLYQLSYVPKSIRPRTWPDGYLVFEESRFMAIRNQSRRPGGPLASIILNHDISDICDIF